MFTIMVFDDRGTGNYKYTNPPVQFQLIDDVVL